MRKKKPFCCWVLIILVAIAFVIYVVQFVKFNTRVKRFDQIKIGSKEIEAHILLGEPSKTTCGIEGETLREFWKVKLSENDLKGKKFMLLVYDGSIYLRKDLFLFYDMDSEKLVYKLKKMEYIIGDVILRWSSSQDQM
ncbi:MAG TPA: hypothetical protein DCX03_07160 [Bacteroidales bacterium]|nr:hypothetical protein [Bacteroidales bacterium]